MEDIYEAQSELFSFLEKLYTNLKKDGEERKMSSGYIKKKLDILESYWSEYQANHEKLLPYEDRERPYFARREYDRCKTLYLEIKNYIGRVSKELATKFPTTFTSTYNQGEGPSKQLTESNKQAEQGAISPAPVSKSSKLQEMLHKQAVNFKALMRTVNSIDLEKITTKWKFEDVLQQLNSRWGVIDTLHWEIDSILDGQDHEYENAFTHHEGIFDRLKEAINTKLWSVSHREHITPQVDIPIFTGNYQQWVSFKNLFYEIVHVNPTLSNAQKMQYLKSKIKGDAERLIQHLQISSENYITCWDILNHRYENKKLIFASHMNMILGLPNMQIQSLVQLKKMYDATKESLNAIKNLDVDISSWDPIIVHILALKLDNQSHADYVESLKQPRELPVLQDFLDYLESKFTMLEQSRRKQEPVIQKPSYIKPNFYPTYSQEVNRLSNYVRNNNYQVNQHNYSGNRHSPKPIMKTYHLSSKINITCPLCNLEHGLYKCKTFLDQPNEIKFKTLNRINICINCLFSHNGKPCSSFHRCRICNRAHNTILHDAISQRSSTSKRPVMYKTLNNNSSNKNGAGMSHVSQNDVSEILLSTAMLRVRSSNGTYITMRALIDQGSQISLITENGAQQLGLKREACHGVIFGVGQNKNNCKGKINIKCASIYNNFEFNTEAYIMNNLIKNLPSLTFEKPAWNYIKKIHLADPDFNISRPVDLLLGADIYSTIALEGIIRGDCTTQPLAQQTHLGWILCGNVHTFQCNIVLTNMDNIKQFWEIEEITETEELSTEDQKCIDFYNKTTRRLADGRYEVRIPFIEQYEQELGSTKELAVAQFKNLEKKFNKQPELAQQYRDFIHEYQQLNHMRRSTSNLPSEIFLPHHSVLRQESTTTKLRVVFNASAKTTTGKSLNDIMCKGPNLQQDLQKLILKWRQFRYAYTADIEKMYRQIKIHEEDQRFQKIIWRDSSEQSLQEHQLTTVTYGTKSAPFLAMMTLRRLATDEKLSFPEVTDIVMESFYMDDLLHGSHTIEEGQKQIYQLNQLLKSGGFTLRKWSSNESELLSSLNNEQNADTNIFSFKAEGITKTLGLQWDSSEDMFTFNCNIKFNNTNKITKRILLAEISKIFDPLGWLAPVVTKLKLLFQSVWQEKLNWDDVIPTYIQREWFKLKADIENINNINIPRWIGCSKGGLIELHGFCDASIKAYAATIYGRIQKGTNNYSTILIASKTKLVPHNKSVSLPRLELCGAHLLSKLMLKVISCYNENNIKMYGWCDSMVVLGWIYGDEARWNTFVSNRVKKIKEVMLPECWRYVKSAENPADAASRGLTVAQLKDKSLRWKGPSWLSQHNYLENIVSKNNYETNHETKTYVSVPITTIQESLIDKLLEKYNSINKITRILAWIQRALTPKSKHRPTCKHITLQECNAAKLRIIRHVQQTEFYNDLHNLQINNRLSSTSKLLSFNPFLDKDNILRVGGRLRNSIIPYDTKHPIIIPHNHRLTYLLIDQAHRLTFHGGAKLTLYTLRRKFWILGGYKTTKKQIRSCVTCRKQNPELKNQLMGDLPDSRCNPAPPFYHTGVDYTGFVEVKASQGRSVRTTKGYIVVFVCK
ncbi:uncharacterized protein LOC123694542 [Colias croceus]|uniref:uncharacterized protein LOC123694542 n=1 Tax=Colias crocea TaxID=72248 RepID=UPI001E27AC06|nr:uncharacterized protein LOC123694542 [Colias croceus]